MLASPEAQACSIIEGVQSVHPPTGSTLAENDRITLSLLLLSASSLDLSVQVDGEDVPFEVLPRFSGVSLLPTRSYAEIVLAEGAAPEGSTITVQGDADGFGNAVSLSYVVGPADEAPLIDEGIDPSLSVSFIPAEDGDTCGIPDRYSSAVEFADVSEAEDGERTRFLELVYYRADQGPDAVVARSVNVPRGTDARVSATIASGEDLSTLCAQVSVHDARGESEVVLEDCDLCSSNPDACAGADSQGAGCTIGGDRSAGWALGLLALFGLRRRYSNSAPSGSSRR